MNQSQPLAATGVERPLRLLGRLATTVLETMAVVLMTTISTLVFVNAVGRYLFRRPLPWTEEVVITAMVWVAAVGVVLAASRGGLIVCDILLTKVPPRALGPLRVATGVAGAGLMLFFAWTTWIYIGLFGGDLTPMLRLPRAVMMSGLLFTLIGLAVALFVTSFRDPRRHLTL